jgi:hypothetical protein
MLYVTHIIKLYEEFLMKETLAKIGDLKIGGRIINKVIFADASLL